MTLDHHDPAAIDAFAEEVDRSLDARQAHSPLWELIGLWAVSGAALTLAQAVDAGWLYPIGLAGVVLWAARVKGLLQAATAGTG